MLLAVRVGRHAPAALRRARVRWCSDAVAEAAAANAAAASAAAAAAANTAAVASGKTAAAPAEPAEEERKVMTPDQILALPLYKMAEAVRIGVCTAEALVAASIKKLQHEAAVYNCMTSLSAGAVSEAAVLDEHLAETGRVVGPLHGVPIVIGDDVHVEGFPTTMGSAVLSQYVPNRSAPVVEALRAAGAIIVGKSNMDEFGLGYIGDNMSTGEMVHPANPQYYPGGAHGGAALCVATESVGCAVAGDCVGELRVPASMCRQVSYVPSPGRYSRGRMWLSSGRQGGAGVIARCVQDVHILDNVLTASAAPAEDLPLLAGKPTPPLDEPKFPKIMIPEETLTGANTSDIERLFQITKVMLANMSCHVHWKVGQTKGEAVTPTLGAGDPLIKNPINDNEELMEVEPSQPQLEQLFKEWLIYSQLLQWEGVSRVLGILEKVGLTEEVAMEKITTERVKRQFEDAGKGAFVDDIEASERAHGQIKELLDTYFGLLADSLDCLMIPTTRTGAHKRPVGLEDHGTVAWHGASQDRDHIIRNCAVVTAAGYPSITIPYGKNLGDKTSSAVLLVGRRGDDERLLAVAAVVENRLRAASDEVAREEALRAAVDGAEGLENMPAWLEDRSKNKWAVGHDFYMSMMKEGAFHWHLVKQMRALGMEVPESSLKKHTMATSEAFKEFTDSVTGIDKVREEMARKEAEVQDETKKLTEKRAKELEAQSREQAMSTLAGFQNS